MAVLSGRWRRSLTTRVTVVATTATAVVMGLLLAGLFVAVTGQLRATTEAGLQARSRDLEAALVAGDGQVLAAEPYAQLGTGAAARLSPALDGTPLLPEGLVVTGSTSLDRDLGGSEGERLRVLVEAIGERPHRSAGRWHDGQA